MAKQGTNKAKGRQSSRHKTQYAAQRIRTENNRVKAIRKEAANAAKYQYGWKIVGTGVDMHPEPCTEGEAGGVKLRTIQRRIEEIWHPKRVAVHSAS